MLTIFIKAVSVYQIACDDMFDSHTAVKILLQERPKGLATDGKSGIHQIVTNPPWWSWYRCILEEKNNEDILNFCAMFHIILSVFTVQTIVCQNLDFCHNSHRESSHFLSDL